MILAKTKKGYGMGTAAQGRMTTHQQKKLDTEQLIAFRDRFALPLTDAQCDACEFVRPPRESPEMAYLHARREKLGGYLPARVAAERVARHARARRRSRSSRSRRPARRCPRRSRYVRMVGQLLKDPVLGKRIVPIIADEARTFGMADLFRQIGIYSPIGQLYQPEDQAQLSYYKEAVDGQILEEGINEAGAIASWIAAATSYSAHGVPMLPMYIYYSMFGFQRVGDAIWAAADSRARGFLLGATAGRTTLSGEGLQHEDGTSHLVASTIPNCRAYDPCFAYELAVILEDGMRRMLADAGGRLLLRDAHERELRDAVDARRAREEGILRGHAPRAAPRKGAKVRLLGAGHDPERGAGGRGVAGEGLGRRGGGVTRSRASPSCGARRWIATSSRARMQRERRGAGSNRSCRRTACPSSRRATTCRAVAGPHPPVDRGSVRGARNRRLRPQRHAREPAPLLRGRPPCDRGRRAARPGRRARAEAARATGSSRRAIAPWNR